MEYFAVEIQSAMTEIENDLATPRQDFQNSKIKDRRQNKLSTIFKTENPDVSSMKLIADLKQYATKTEVFLNEYKENPNNWVIEKTYNEKAKHYELSMEPIWAQKYLQKYVYSRYDYIIMLSGTILNKSLFSEINGIDVEKSVYYSIPSPFPEENRKIFYMPLGKMSFNKKEETFKKYIPILHKLLAKYSTSKGLIHSNSFELSRWIQESVKNDRLLFHESADKEEALREHMGSEKPLVLVSPSISKGVSFDDDLARFQIIPKIPYPSLASQKNKLRQSTKPEWYSWKTCCDLQQMCGRGIRSKIDYCDTIIIDGSFGDLLRYSSHLFPKWLLDSIKTINVK